MFCEAKLARSSYWGEMASHPKGRKELATGGPAKRVDCHLGVLPHVLPSAFERRAKPAAGKPIS